MMKKIVFGIAVVTAFGFASCKKDYTCKCTFSDGSVINAELKNAKKKDAKSTCESAESTYKIADSGVKCAL